MQTNQIVQQKYWRKLGSIRMLNKNQEIQQVAKTILFNYGISIFYLINPLLSSYQINFWYWSLSDWYLVDETWECGGFEKNAGRKKTLKECAYSCQRSAYMFIYGTNDFGENRCNDSGCDCYCELQSVLGRCDYRVRHKGYRLYKYTSDNIGENETLRDEILFLRC